MIIKISQTASNIKQSYNIESENFYYRGEAGSISRLQSITLSNKENIIKGIYNISKWVNYIPLRYLFGQANLTRVFHLYKNDNIYGSIVFSKHGFLKSFYVIALDSGEIFHCYCLSRGSYNYVSIYQGDTQIALVETYLSVNDYKYTHKLYLLDDYNQFADTLSFFVLYYASYNFAQRMHMSKGSVNEKAYSISKYASKYNPKWRETYFPHENFFGKTSLINKSYGDI
ncbi:MAG: hypothetical protein J6I80_00510 [Clostridia bacterium]|nr:hypothetical protein [Clostridia bacterium]